MKSVFTILVILVTVVTGLAGLSEAGILDTAGQFIQAHPARTGVFYNFTEKKAHEYLAATIVENVFIDKLDISAASDFDKAIIGQLDYSFKKDTSISPYVGIGCGLDRIEKTKELGEFIYEAHCGVKF